MERCRAATTPDINSQHWNPADTAFSSDGGFSFSYTPWLSKLVSDINLLYAAGYWKFDEQQSVSASLRFSPLVKSNSPVKRPEDDYGTAHPNNSAFDLAPVCFQKNGRLLLLSGISVRT